MKTDGLQLYKKINIFLSLLQIAVKIQQLFSKLHVNVYLNK